MDANPAHVACRSGRRVNSWSSASWFLQSAARMSRDRHDEAEIAATGVDRFEQGVN